MNKTLGVGTYVTDQKIINRVTGGDLDREGCKGIMRYELGDNECDAWIDVLQDGRYQLFIERDIYVDADLGKLEDILGKWIDAEREGMARWDAESKKKAFLSQVRAIAEAMERIIEMNEGNIVNEVAVKSYPFTLSLDEVHSEVLKWAEDIEDDIERNQGDK